MSRAGQQQRRGGLLARFAPLLRALVVALVFPLASSGALPFWAQLAGVEGPHVCHCSLEHHDCVCPRCDTDPDGSKYLSTESLKGRCGDDELAFGSKAITAVLGASVTIVAAAADDVLPIESAPERSVLGSPPPTPPPQA